MRYLLMALALSGCAAPQLAPMTPECSGGVCIYRDARERVIAICYMLYGSETESGCWVPDIQAGFEWREAISPDVCRGSHDPDTCRRELF